MSDANTDHTVPCPLCGEITTLTMELDGDCNVVCHECDAVVTVADMEAVIAAYQRIAKIQAMARKIMGG